jgi:hypothetical protein
MNREFVLFNLREVLEEVERTIKEIESDPEYVARSVARSGSGL